MEFSLAHEEAPQANDSKENSKGGLKTIPIIMAMIVFEKIASTGLMVNMIVYITQEYHIPSATAASSLFVCSAAMNFVPAFGALLSDSYLGRFQVIAFGSFTSLIGMTLLWLTAMLPGGRPPPCNQSQHDCVPATSAQLAFLYMGFAVLAIGAGGVRPCTIAFGADQLEPQKNNPNKERALQSFFNWYNILVSLSILIAVTVLAYIQVNIGWKVGFGLPAVLMLLSTVLFFSGSPLYVKVKGNKDMLLGSAQVFVASFKNRSLTLPPDNSNGDYLHIRGSKLVAPTGRLRFFNKACLIRDCTKDLKPDGSATNPWRLCTVDQVENVKQVVRVIPIWSAAAIADLMNNQSSFMTLQAQAMDRHIGEKFEIPAGSFSLFSLITLIIWVAFYDRILIPVFTKLTGRKRLLKIRHRMAIGLVIFCSSMVVAAVVERHRRRAMVPMSAMWLVPQHGLSGIAVAFCIITQIEFYYSELPKSMASLGMALFEMGMGMGNLVGSVLVWLVDELSKRNGIESWVSSNLNKGHYDYYYWLLALLCGVNLLYFLACSWAYGEEGKNKEKGVDEQE